MTQISTQTAAPRTVDAGLWPDVARAAGSPVRAAVARALFTAAVARLPMRVQLPDGRLLGTRPQAVLTTAPQAALTTPQAALTTTPQATPMIAAEAGPMMTLHRPREYFRRLGSGGLCGFEIGRASCRERV